jgi:hypothetical protein
MVKWGAAALAMTAIIAPLTLLGVLGSIDWLAGGQPLFDSALAVPPDGEVCESVAILEPRLDRIDVNLVRGGPTNGGVVLRLTADPAGHDVLASAEVPSSVLEDQSNPMRRPLAYTAFRFPALSSVASGQVWLWLQSRADRRIYARVLTDPARSADDACPGAGEGHAPLTQYRSLHSVATLTHSRLALRLHYQRSVTDNLAVLAGRLTHERPGVLGKSWFYIMVTTAYSALLASTAWFLFR